MTWYMLFSDDMLGKKRHIYIHRESYKVVDMEWHGIYHPKCSMIHMTLLMCVQIISYAESYILKVLHDY